MHAPPPAVLEPALACHVPPEVADRVDLISRLSVDWGPGSAGHGPGGPRAVIGVETRDGVATVAGLKYKQGMEETPRRIRLTQWAAHNGIPHRIARQMMASGTLPGDLDPIKIGRFWFVRAPDEAPRETVLYARVSSRDQKSDLDRQKLRLLEHAQRERITVGDVVTEIGSGLNGARPKLVRMLERPRLVFVLIEHRERLARFGFEMVDAAAPRSGRACHRRR